MGAFVLLSALYAYLEQQLVLTGMLQGIFDEVPENEPFPYLLLGDITDLPADGFFQTRRNTTATLHIWSEATGMQQITTIMDQLSLLLHHQTVPNIASFSCIRCEREFETTLRESDGITRHGVQRYRFLLEKTNPEW